MLVRCLIACLLVCGVRLVQADDLYDVGHAVVDITPNYPIRLNGFGNRRQESQGVSQKIFAKALAISQGDAKPLVLLTLDSLGIRSSMADDVAERLAKSHQLPRQNLAITFTHTHCAPKVNGASDNIFSQAIPAEHQAHIDRYSKQLADQITTVAQRAIDMRKPASLHWAVGKVEFAKNRRTVGGPVDHDLPMLVVRDPNSERPRLVYVSYACHCVTLSFNRISGDWAGYAAAMIERQIPGCVAMVSIGAGSDQNPVSGVTGDQVQIAEGQGLQIASEVTRLLSRELKSINGTPGAVLNRIALSLNKLPTRAELIEQTGKGRATDKYNATTQLARLDRGEKLISQIDYTVQTWMFGESFCMTFLAGEVCVDYALRLKKELDRERFWLNAYSNDFCSYIPSERLIQEGGYGGGAEVPYFALPTTLKPGLEKLIVDEVHRQVPQTFHVPPGTQGVPPKSPQESMKCMTTHEEFEIALAAAEPQVTDPVAIDFGADGRLWVVEMNDYGQGVYESFQQSGRVRWLRDEDNDGYFDDAETFVDGLRFPTDVKVWRDGVLICDAPEILFARDTNGDGTADDLQTLFAGFEVRNAQARVNSLRFGLDQWIYGACGLFGGKIKSLKTGRTVDCSNRDFRMNPDTGAIEPVAGRTQQGRCRNDFGDWFGCSNGTLIRAIPADDRYVNRNPFAAPSTPPGIVVADEALKLYPPENLVTFELSGAPGRATAACGLGIYRDDLLGAEFNNDAFTCEPVHQSVHRIDLSPQGHGYAGKRGAGEESSEFLSSTDRWFRPVQARTGPDGALWVVDMYRYVIEHSRWIPQSTLAELDVYAGRGRGRIYRVVRKESAPQSAPVQIIPNLADMPNDELVAMLDSGNGIIRDLVHQQLLWRSATDAIPALRELIKTAQHPTAMIHALYVLEQMDQLQPSDIHQALKSHHPEVLRVVVRLSEPFLNDSPGLQGRVFELAASDQVRIRRPVAFATGYAEGVDATNTLIRLLSRQEPDAHVRSAALNSVTAANVGGVLRSAYELPMARRDQTVFPKLVMLAINVGDSETVNETLSQLLGTESLPTVWSADLWVGALNALDDRVRRSGQLKLDPDVLTKLNLLHLTALSAARRNDRNQAHDEDVMAVIKLLGRRFGPFSQSLPAAKPTGPFSTSSRVDVIAAFVSPRYSTEIQQAAIAGIAAVASPESIAVLLNAVSSLSGETRLAVVDALLDRKDGQVALLTAVESGQLRVEVLDASRRSKLLSSTSDEIRLAAQRILKADQISNRAEVVASMAEALVLTGNVGRGREIFGKRCASCHKLEGVGYVVGPDLQALTNRDPKWLLTTMLDPNRQVDARYFAWTAVTNSGRVVSGMIVEETPATIVLRESGGKEHSIARSDIDQFQSAQRSVMPEGLERDMSAQDFSDIIAFLSGIESPFKALAGNQPQVIRQDSDGFLGLTAATAELRGGDITFETPFANIGHWHHQNDSARWKMDVKSPGVFDIYVNASCASSSAGNRFQIDGLAKPILGNVASTGGWDRFRQFKVGTTPLPSGRHVITVRPANPVSGALFDLREVRLVPAGSDPKFAATDLNNTPLPRRPPEIAPFLLDEAQSKERRRKVIDQRPGMGPAIVTLLTDDLKPGDAEELYRRIPWIWQVAIAVGKRNDGGEIRDMLEICVPNVGQPLRDWQAVVIGGGLINGISELGLWPKKRINEILVGLPDVQKVWPRALQLAAEMADNANVRTGTRYDALRMVALQHESIAVPHLLRYLNVEANTELQMGSVSGLADIESAVVTTALADSLDWLQGQNRSLAIKALLRTEERAAALLKRIESGGVILTPAEKEMSELAGKIK